MDIAIMIEGQNGLNWTRWQRIVRAVEELGFAGLYRSDHYTNAEPPDKDSLELWVSLTWLASHTQRIEFGPMVAPSAFRHPSMTARMAAAVDDLSEGRLTLGLGAGWQEREHSHYGFDLLPIPQRFARFEEYVTIVTSLLKNDEPVNFKGNFYQLEQATLLPRPQRPGGPPILIGGGGRKRTLPLVAKYADAWNVPFKTPKEFAKLSKQLDDLLKAVKREPQKVHRSLMTGLFFGKDAAELQAKLDAHGRTLEDLHKSGVVAGTPDIVQEQLKRYDKAGVQRIMLQWIDLDNMDGLETFAKTVL